MGKTSIKEDKQDAEKVSEKDWKGTAKYHLIFPLPKTGLMACKMSATEALEFGQTWCSWALTLTSALHCSLLDSVQCAKLPLPHQFTAQRTRCYFKSHYPESSVAILSYTALTLEWCPGHLCAGWAREWLWLRGLTEMFMAVPGTHTHMCPAGLCPNTAPKTPQTGSAHILALVTTASSGQACPA